MQMLADWWHSHTPFLQFYYIVAVVSFLALLIQAVLLMVGLPGDADLGLSGHGEGLGVVSVRTITAFLVGFGWSGVLMLEAGAGTVATVAVSTVGGAALMVAAHLLFLKLLKLQTQGNVNYSSCVGQVGTVYVTIPPGGGDGGQIELMAQGRLRFVKALTAGSEPIPPGTKVRVTSVVDAETLMVEKLVA